MVGPYMISFEHNTSGVTPTVALDLLNVFDKIWHTTALLREIRFCCVYGRCFFFLRHSLVVEDYELPQSSTYLLSVLLTLEYVRILSWPISFFSTSILADDILRKIPI